MTDPMEALGAALTTRQSGVVVDVLSRFPSLKARLDEPVSGGAFGATAPIVAVQQANRELVDLLLGAERISTSEATGGPAVSTCSKTITAWPTS